MNHRLAVILYHDIFGTTISTFLKLYFCFAVFCCTFIYSVVSPTPLISAAHVLRDATSEKMAANILALYIVLTCSIWEAKMILFIRGSKLRHFVKGLW